MSEWQHPAGRQRTLSDAERIVDLEHQVRRLERACDHDGDRIIDRVIELERKVRWLEEVSEA